jgi:quercetin dioxygenase-like cupin family protein
MRWRKEMMMADEWKARLDRPIAVPLLNAGLAEQLDRLKQESTWRTSGRNAIRLTKEPTLRVVLLLLGKESKMPEHQAAGPLTLHVLAGSVALRTGGSTVEIGAGEFVALDRH